MKKAPKKEIEDQKVETLDAFNQKFVKALPADLIKLGKALQSKQLITKHGMAVGVAVIARTFDARKHGGGRAIDQVARQHNVGTKMAQYAAKLLREYPEMALKVVLSDKTLTWARNQIRAKTGDAKWGWSDPKKPKKRQTDDETEALMEEVKDLKATLRRARELAMRNRLSLGVVRKGKVPMPLNQLLDLLKKPF